MTQPVIRDQSGKVVTTGKISKPSGTAYSTHDAEREALKRIKAEEEAAKQEQSIEASEPSGCL